ncbi:MAG: response regulator [Deltaproteobacteria bacterium]|nr:response regulator [Deltaproteobacteria bacterium]
MTTTPPPRSVAKKSPFRWLPERPRFLDRVLDERARLLWHTLFFFLIVITPVSVIGVLASLDTSLALVIYGAVFVVFAASLALLLRRRVTLAALVLCLALASVVLLVVLGVGRPGTIYAAGFIPLALLARATLGPRAGLLVTSLFVAFLAVAIALHQADLYPSPFIPTTAFDETLAAIVFLLGATVFTFVTTRTLEETVDVARTAADTERAMAAQARVLAQLGSDALAHPSVQLAEEVVHQIQALPGARWATIISLARRDVAVMTGGLATEVRSEIEARADDIIAGRETGGFASAPSITRCELALPDGPAGVLIAGFDDRTAAAGAASFLKTAASLLSSAIDRERRQAELIRAQKRDAAGRIAANISHDFNNLLATIAADAWALGQLTGGAARDITQQILEATRRGARLTGRLRALNRNLASVAEPILLEHAVDRFVAGLRQRRPPEVEVALAHDGAALPIVMDRGDLDQLLEALTSNALIAMPRGGRLTVELSRRADDGAGRASIVVADTGVGMDEATRERVFEPFFTTRDGAAGLGLTLAREVLERIGGAIEVSSTPERGTAVRVEIPLSDARVDPAPAVIPTGVGRREVLLVEDDALVRKSVQRVLERAGYAVVEAVDGLAALEVLASRTTIRMVVSDIAMPRMSGVELARRVKAERGLPVALMSGYADERVADATVTVLTKPFPPNDLLDVVTRVIGPAEAPAAPAAGEQTSERPRDEVTHALFVAMVVHDINNALSVIVPGAALLKDMAGTGVVDADAIAIVEDIDQAAQTCLALARQALRIADPRARPEPVRLDELVRAVERPLAKLLNGRGRLVVTTPTATRPVIADRGALERAVFNLVLNARDALDGPGQVTVTVRDDATTVVLEVKDDGRGIEPEVMPRLFEPFFTTKAGGGTGLGLTVVKAAVDELGGRVEVESTPGQGATFRLRLPAA